MFACFLARSYGFTRWQLGRPNARYVPATNAKTFNCPGGVAGTVNTVMWGMGWANAAGEPIICSDAYGKPYSCNFGFVRPPMADPGVTSVDATFTYRISGNTFFISPTDMGVVSVMRKLCEILFCYSVLICLGLWTQNCMQFYHLAAMISTWWNFLISNLHIHCAWCSHKLI